METTAHYFIAIPVSLELKEEFAEWQEELRQTFSYKQWPYKADFHITLKFLGGVEEGKLQELRQSLGTIQDQASFSLTVGQIGTFGKPDSPRVLWAGVEKVPQLQNLFQRVEQVVTSLGFSKENRAYRPHITLAKKWNGSFISEQGMNEVKNRFQSRTYSMRVESLVLYQIHPSKKPMYEVVETFKFKGW